MRTSIPALIALLTLTAACELLPCEFNPAACDTDATATATAGGTAGDTGGDTDDPGPCPGVDNMWTPCGDGSTAPNGLPCGGQNCVEADGPASGDVCTLQCGLLSPGDPCHVQIPYCPLWPNGQVVAGRCVEVGDVVVCLGPCETAADCPLDGMTCELVGGEPSCVWPNPDGCVPAAGDPWGPCSPLGECPDGGQCTQGSCAPPCPPGADGETCEAAACGGGSPATMGVCRSLSCLLPCATEADCPFAGMACLGGPGWASCGWP